MASDKANSRRAGRPSYDDEEQICAYFTLEIAKGRSVQEIAKEGLVIVRHGARPACSDHPWPTITRHLRGEALEGRYREARRKLLGGFDHAMAHARQGNFRYLGISEPRSPLSFTSGVELKRGRPRKIRPH